MRLVWLFVAISRRIVTRRCVRRRKSCYWLAPLLAILRQNEAMSGTLPLKVGAFDTVMLFSQIPRKYDRQSQSGLARTGTRSATFTRDRSRLTPKKSRRIALNCPSRSRLGSRPVWVTQPVGTGIIIENLYDNSRYDND